MVFQGREFPGVFTPSAKAWVEACPKTYQRVSTGRASAELELAWVQGRGTCEQSCFAAADYLRLGAKDDVRGLDQRSGFHTRRQA
ncbi:hypothetical protein PPUN110474_03980 [Pseudomonas putida]|nr:hypothetical protein PPUN110474_03980 [Pseudomonas putida]